MSRALFGHEMKMWDQIAKVVEELPPMNLDGEQFSFKDLKIIAFIMLLQLRLGHYFGRAETLVFDPGGEGFLFGDLILARSQVKANWLFLHQHIHRIVVLLVWLNFRALEWKSGTVITCIFNDKYKLKPFEEANKGLQKNNLIWIEIRNERCFIIERGTRDARAGMFSMIMFSSLQVFNKDVAGYVKALVKIGNLGDSKLFRSLQRRINNLAYSSSLKGNYTTTTSVLTKRSVLTLKHAIEGVQEDQVSKYLSSGAAADLIKLLTVVGVFGLMKIIIVILTFDPGAEGSRINGIAQRARSLSILKSMELLLLYCHTTKSVSKIYKEHCSLILEGQGSSRQGRIVTGI